MGKPGFLELGTERNPIRMPIVYEDRSVLAIDKLAGWMLAPDDWDRTSRNLQLAIISSIHEGAFWAKSRNLKFLRFIHRLDAETSGLVLFCKSSGAISRYSQLFETRQIRKRYLAVVAGKPAQREWKVTAPIEADPAHKGRMKVLRGGKEAETEFRVLEERGEIVLIEAFPLTGRTHQIRLHLQHSDLPIVGDELYGGPANGPEQFPLGLRATNLEYPDPFTRKRIRIRADEKEFRKAFGFSDGSQKKEPETAVK